MTRNAGNPRRVPRIERFDPVAWQEDVALMQELAERENLADDLRKSIERYLIGMYELRRRWEQPHNDN